jgi:hypothetical protein
MPAGTPPRSILRAISGRSPRIGPPLFLTAAGDVARTVVPAPQGLSTSSVPPSAPIRSASTSRPQPRVRSASPIPSSATSTIARSPMRETETVAADACAYFATFTRVKKPGEVGYAEHVARQLEEPLEVLADPVSVSGRIAPDGSAADGVSAHLHGKRVDCAHGKGVACAESNPPGCPAPAGSGAASRRAPGPPLPRGAAGSLAPAGRGARARPSP